MMRRAILVTLLRHLAKETQRIRITNPAHQRRFSNQKLSAGGNSLSLFPIDTGPLQLFPLPPRSKLGPELVQGLSGGRELVLRRAQGGGELGVSLPGVDDVFFFVPGSAEKRQEGKRRTGCIGYRVILCRLSPNQAEPDQPHQQGVPNGFVRFVKCIRDVLINPID